MKLTDLYDELHRQAERTGEDRVAELTGGARLCVRVRNRVVTLSLARRGKKVGDVEETTFRVACKVPLGATRWPVEGQHQRERNGATYHQIVYHWFDQEEAPRA